MGRKVQDQCRQFPTVDLRKEILAIANTSSDKGATHASSIEPECPPVNIQVARSGMSVNEVGGHAWEALPHGVHIRSVFVIVANAAVHHLVVAFRPGSAVFVTPARSIIRLKNVRVRRPNLTE